MWGRLPQIRPGVPKLGQTPPNWGRRAEFRERRQQSVLFQSEMEADEKCGKDQSKNLKSVG